MEPSREGPFYTMNTVESTLSQLIIDSQPSMQQQSSVVQSTPSSTSPSSSSSSSSAATAAVVVMPNLQNQVALILGATGVIGTGATEQFLEAGARVVIVARTEDKLKGLMNQFAPRKSQLIGIVGEFDTRSQVEEIRAVVKATLNGESVDHVVSAIGFVSLTAEGIISGDINALKKSMDDSLYPTVLCAQVFLQDIRGKPGATYTVVSGGFAHRCYSPNGWVGTIKSAAMNGVIASLACDTANSPVRVNGNCLHYGVAIANEETNQIGLRVEGSAREFARTFIRIVERTDLKGEIICHETPEDMERFLTESAGVHPSSSSAAYSNNRRPSMPS